jgi:ABC-type lipoprotein export system ATPase subunit
MSKHAASHGVSQLRGEALRYQVGSQVILDGIDVQADAGAMLAVSGPSGAGKSSLLGLLAGLLRPTAGTVTLDGTPVVVGDVALRRRVGLVLQGYGLVSALTARENVSITLQARKLDRAQIRTRTAEALESVGITAVADHLIEDLSGGQQQRVAIARAIVGSPDVLVADEPTSELDADNRGRVIDLLATAARNGTIVVIASHDRDVVACCDDELRLEAGALVH